MQFRDLKQQYLSLKSEIDQAITNVAASSAYIMGPQVKEIEHKLAEYTGTKHCISCANGTDALSIALKVWKIGAGDAVFVPDFTFFASAEVVSLEGATPIFVDVDLDTFNISPTSLDIAINKTIKEGKLKPKVVIAVDLFGLPANYPEIRQICDKYNLLLLEDGAQGFGGSINNKRSCSFGDISTTSFFPAKPLGCYGDGGAIFTDNDNWATLADSYRVHGKGSFKYDNERIGMNSRLDTIQAAILLVKLKAFKDYELKAVNIIADKYTKSLSERNLSEIIKTPLIPTNFYSSWAQYSIRFKTKEKRDRMQTILKSNDIPSMIYYPIPMHCQSAYKNLNYSNNSFPASLELCNTVLSLPMHPYLTDEEINHICNIIKINL